MSVAAGTNWEFQTGGADTMGGGFGGTQGAAQLTLTDGACTAGSVTFTSVTGGFTAGMVGSVVVITSGLNVVLGEYVIATQSDTNTITLDHSPTNAGTGNASAINFTVSQGINYPYTAPTVAKATLTTLSVVGATTTDIVVSVTDYVTSNSDIGNVMYLTGGSATAGFYQITSIPVAGTWRMDRSVGTAGQTCPGKMGGARKLISSNSFAAALVAGNTVWVKNGSYSHGGWSSQTNGTALAPIQILGYNSSRGDNPTSTNRPTLTGGGNAITLGNFTIFRNFIMTGSGSLPLSATTSDVIENVKITSTNATSTNNAVQLASNVSLINCEVIAASCNAVKASTGPNFIFGNYIHGSTVGINVVAISQFISNNIISGNATSAISLQTTGLTGIVIQGNTLFGAETPAGTGIDGSTATAPTRSVFENNIIYGFTTGVNWQAAQPINWWDYNDFFNNTTNRTNVQVGPHDVAINPGFTNTAGGDFSISGAI